MHNVRGIPSAKGMMYCLKCISLFGLFCALLSHCDTARSLGASDQSDPNNYDDSGLRTITPTLAYAIGSPVSSVFISPDRASELLGEIAFDTLVELNTNEYGIVGTIENGGENFYEIKYKENIGYVSFENLLRLGGSYSGQSEPTIEFYRAEFYHDYWRQQAGSSHVVLKSKFGDNYWEIIDKVPYADTGLSSTRHRVFYENVYFESLTFPDSESSLIVTLVLSTAEFGPDLYGLEVGSTFGRLNTMLGSDSCTSESNTMTCDYETESLGHGYLATIFYLEDGIIQSIEWVNHFY